MSDSEPLYLIEDAPRCRRKTGERESLWAADALIVCVRHEGGGGINFGPNAQSMVNCPKYVLAVPSNKLISFSKNDSGGDFPLRHFDIVNIRRLTSARPDMLSHDAMAVESLPFSGFAPGAVPGKRASSHRNDHHRQAGILF